MGWFSSIVILLQPYYFIFTIVAILSFWLLCRIETNKTYMRICLIKQNPNAISHSIPNPWDGAALNFININVPLVHFYVLMSELILVTNGPLIYLASRTCRHLGLNFTHVNMALLSCQSLLGTMLNWIKLNLKPRQFQGYVSFSLLWDCVNSQWNEGIRNSMANFPK